MPTHVDADVQVQRFGFVGDGAGNRLVFPHAQAGRIEGHVRRDGGATSYGAAECTFEALESRLGTLRWSAESASIGGAWLRDVSGRFEIVADRIELPHGLLLVRGASSRLELVSSHVSLSEAHITIKGPRRSEPANAGEQGPTGRSSSAPVEAPPSPTRRQERLRFLDSLTGRIYVTLKVQLDLPVLGVRTLDQALRVPIQEGSLDFRALEEGLDWLEGAFLDIDAEGDQLKVQWKVPIFGSSHDLITWTLGQDASTLAAFGRVPVRSLADFRLGSLGSGSKPSEGKRKILRAFSVEAMDLALSLLAPRNLDVGGGMIAFGGDGQPGMLDLKVGGAIHDRGAGTLKGAIGSLDTTIKDVRIGPIELTADRLHFDGLDHVEVSFDGFRPTSVTAVVHRVTATNLAVKLGH